MAETTEQQQQFLDAYKGQSAEMQQKMYNAGNAQVKALIDQYNADNNITPSTPTPTETPTPTPTPTSQDEVIKTGNGRPDQQGELLPETYKYYSNDTDDAQTKIVNNLNSYWQNTPQLFNNYDSFKKNFSYDARTNRQKQTLDDWRFGYDTARNLGSKSADDLLTLYNSWQISESDLNNLRAFYPDKYNQVMNNRDTESDMNKYYDMLYWWDWSTWSDTDIMSAVKDQFLNYILWNRTNTALNFYEEYNAEINTPEMTEMSDRQTDLQAEIRKIDSDLNSLYRDIEKRYEGTGASKAKIQAIYADEAYDLQIQRNSLAIELEALATKYNSRIQQAQTNFEMKTKQYELENAEKNQYMKELWFAMDLINFETNEEADERAWKNWTRQIDYQYGNIDSLDPVARKKAVDNSVSQILDQYDWIPMQRSKDQMVEDVLKLVDWGMSLWEALTQNIITPIKSKPEYITWYNSKLWVDSPVQYSMNANWQLELTAWTATVPKWTTWYNYSSIDLGNWYSVSVNPNKVVTINGQWFRITQLWWETKTSWLDLAPVTVWDNQEIQAFIGWTLVNWWYWQDKSWNNRVEILWDNGYVYRYNHLKDFNEALQQIKENWGRIEAGTVIWRMGNTWHTLGATWVHLDLAVYDWSRAWNKSVSPLNALDQARIFFSSVSAQWLGIGSTSTSVTNVADTKERNYSWLTNEQILEVDEIATNILWKTQAKADVTTHNAVAELLRQWKSKDYIYDYLRKQWISEVLQKEPKLYNAATSLMSSLYWSNQEKTFNALDKIEDYVESGDYAQAYNYTLSQLLTDDSKLLSKEAKASIVSAKDAIIALQDVNDLFEQYINSWWDIWVLKDMYRAAAKENFVWNWEWDEQLNNLLTRMWFAINDYIFKKSWKTVTDAEREMYNALFPSRLWRTSVSRTKNAFNSVISTFEDSINWTYRAALYNDFDDLNEWYGLKTGKTFQWRMLWNYYRSYTDYSDID